MAGVVSNKLIDKLTATLADKLIQEVSLAVNYKADLQRMCDELVAIKSLLNDAKDKTNSDSVTNWLQKLQAFLIDAVETVDKCDEQEVKNNFKLYFSNPFFRWRMGRKIKELKKRISDIHANGEKYIRYLASVLDVNARAHESALSLTKKSSAIPLDHQIVGMDEDIKTITEKVKQEDIGKQGPRVIAVLGMAGMGKTLLVRHVFNKMAKEHTGNHKRFDHCIWLAVTQIFDIKELLHEMLRQIEKDDHDNANMIMEQSTESLRRCIHSKLDGKCCFFVLDDVWQKDILEQIGLALGTNEENDQKKSKIVVSTRYKGVSDAMGAYYTHRMRYLSERDKLQLFCIHAFRIKKGESIQLPPKLEDLGPLILNKCSSLPLAVEEIGKYMAQVKRMRYNWEAHFKRLDEASILNRQVMPTLRLSYQGLPDHLKPCFLYFSSFPPNTPIGTEHLVYPWIAQEFVFVSSKGVNVAYDVAISYLNELVKYCMIQVSEIHLDGRARTYRMEDMLHRLALSESHKEAKCFLMPGKGLREFPKVEEYRGAHRISLLRNEISGTINEKMGIQCPRLRALLLQKNKDLTSISKTLFNKLKYLVVLDLSETAITSLPESIRNLKGLKFLNLSRTKILELPKFLGNLRSLQYLDVSGCADLRRLHLEIGEHKDMLHLNLERCKKLESLPPAISELRYLRTLKLLGVVNAFVSVDIKNMPHLQNLSISFNQKLTISSAAASVSGFIQKMTGQGMRFLSLEYVPSNGECYPVKLGYMENLETIILHKCILEPARDWHVQFWNLRVLVLDGDASSYGALETIPNLAKLSLLNNRSCMELLPQFGQAHAFPELKTLEINTFMCLKCFPSLDSKAMPKLKSLIIKNCDQLSLKPSQLGPLKPLKKSKKLIIENCRRLNIGPCGINGLADDEQQRWRLFSDNPQSGHQGDAQKLADDEQQRRRLFSDNPQLGHEGDAQKGHEGDAQSGHEGDAQKGHEGDAQSGDEGDAQSGHEGDAQSESSEHDASECEVGDEDDAQSESSEHDASDCEVGVGADDKSRRRSRWRSRWKSRKWKSE